MRRRGLARMMTWAIALCAIALVGVVLSQFVHGAGGAFLSYLAGALAAAIAAATVRGLERRRRTAQRKREARTRWQHQQALKSRVRFTDSNNL